MEELTHNDIAKYFSSLNTACAACNSNDWAITSISHRVALVYLDADMNFKMNPPMIPAIAAICLSCGYIRLHEQNILNTAILAKKYSDGNE